MLCRSAGVSLLSRSNRMGRENLYLGDHSRRVVRKHSLLFSFFSVFPTEMSPTQPRIVPWTPEEDERLALAVSSCKFRVDSLQLSSSQEPTGGSKICWKRVATSMPGTSTGLNRVHSLIPSSAGRNNKSCRKRWLHSLDPQLRKGKSERSHASRTPSLYSV